jgi:tetratricopeptide (TPR) repeat protein
MSSFVVKKFWAALILLALVLVTYAPALRNGFVWDDTALILRDPLIRSWRLVPESFNHFLFIDATPSDFYRPLQRLSYTLDYALAGFRPALYHVTSVLSHGVAAIALLFFAEEFLVSFGLGRSKSRLIALMAALVWAVHPVQSAAVVYISGRADPLATSFGFLGLFFLVRTQQTRGGRRLFLFVASGTALLLSALSKEAGLIFPVIGLLIFLLRKNWRDLWRTTAATAFVGAIYFVLRFGAEHYPAPQFTPPPPPLVRPIIVARAVAEYAGLILFPLNLHMDRDVETQPSGLNEASLAHAAWRELQTLLGLVLIAAFFLWLFRARKRRPAVFCSLLFALISYLPVSGIVALNATVAEHWIYLPSAFLFVAIAVELASLAERLRSRRSTIACASLVLAVWVIFLSGRTFARTLDWRDQRTFLERTIACGGDSARMLINLGGLELNEGRLQEAAVHLYAALQKKPDQPLAIINLAALALKQNDFKVARELLNRATQMPIVDAEAHRLLAVLEHKEHGKVDVMRMRLASRTGPPNWAIEKNYIQLLDERDARSAAINELLSCLQTQWYRAESWLLLSELETKAGHPDQSANALAQARAYDVHMSVSAPLAASASATASAAAAATASASPSKATRTKASPAATSTRQKGGTESMQGTESPAERAGSPPGHGAKGSKKSAGAEKPTGATSSKSAETAASPSGKKSSPKKSKEEATETVPTPGGEQE